MSITHDAKLFPSTWAVVLAAGDGSRLSTLTRDAARVAVSQAGLVSFAAAISPDTQLRIA
jgi:hypothetical protein